MTFSLHEQNGPNGWPGLWILTFDLPGEKVNKFNAVVMSAFEKTLIELETLVQSKRIDVLALRSGKPGQFVAGADLEFILTIKDPKEAEALSRTGQKMLDRWEDLPFPKVALIDGPALGGGCEFALACRAIVMSSDRNSKIGLPEVMLGLLPGMGGCGRMVRKVGLATALDLILSGRALSGEKAFKAGLIEAYLPKEDFEAQALRWIQTNLSQLKSNVRIARPPKLGGIGGAAGALLESTMIGRRLILKKAKDGVMAKTRGQYPSPLEVLELIKKSGVRVNEKWNSERRAQVMEREAQGFGRVATSRVSQYLIGLFFETERVKKFSGLTGVDSVSSPAVQQCGVLGAGVMGGGIAQLLAEKDIQVRMKDLNSQALGLGVQAASKLFQKQVQKRKIDDRQAQKKLGLIVPQLDDQGFGQLDVVIEAVVENLEVKRKVFKELESQVSSNCVLVTNTSSLSVSEIQKALTRPERFAGMHFFNPVHRMPLIEVIRGDQSSDATVAAVYALSKRLGKTPVVVKDSPGFLVNRLLMVYLTEAVHLLSEGVLIEELDRAFLDFGMPMGPIELIDEVGIDVGEKVAHILSDAFGERMKPSALNAKALKMGLLGKKSGKGFYEYEGRKKRLNGSIYSLLGIKPKERMMKPEEMVARCIYPMVNEAARCLAEGVVARAADVDLAMIMGTGFPPFRGGLLHYADQIGLRTIENRLSDFEKRWGVRFAPSTALMNLVKDDRKFHGN